MPDILFPEFRDAYASTNYPFSDRSTLSNQTGQIILQGVFLGASLYPVGGAVGFYLSQVEITHETCTLTIGDSQTEALASGSFPLLTPPSILSLTDIYGRPAGILVSSPELLVSFQAWGTGTFVFDRDEAEFCADVCFPTPDVGVRGIQLPDGTLFTDEVWLVGEDGVVLETDSVSVNGPNGAVYTYPIIRINVVGDPLFVQSQFQPAGGFIAIPAVRQIQFQKGAYSFLAMPDAAGNIRINVSNETASDTALRITTTAGGIQFSMAGEALTG